MRAATHNPRSVSMPTTTSAASDVCLATISWKRATPSRPSDGDRVLELAHLDQWRDSYVVVVVDSLVFDRCSHPEGGVASLPVVEDFEVFEDSVGQRDAGAAAATVEEFDLHQGPKRFHQRVIKSSPGLTPMEGTRPDWWARSVNAQEVKGVPWSEWITVSGSG